MVGGDMFRVYYSKMTDEEKEILEKWSQMPPKVSKEIL